MILKSHLLRTLGCRSSEFDAAGTVVLTHRNVLMIVVDKQGRHLLATYNDAGTIASLRQSEATST